MGLYQHALIAFEASDLNSFILYLKTVYSSFKDNYFYIDLTTVVKWFIGLLLGFSQIITGWKNIKSYHKQWKSKKRLEWMITALSKTEKENKANKK